MNGHVYPWQQGAWQQLQALRPRMPHAILFHGAAGIGKADFIEQFAQAEPDIPLPPVGAK